jgi:hypothetical protein
MRVEALHKRKLGTETGLWIENMTGVQVVPYDPNAVPGTFVPPPPTGQLPPEYAEGGRYAPVRRSAEDIPPGAPAPTPDGTAGASGVSTNDPSVMTVTFRGVRLDQISGNPNANKDVAFAVQNELKALPLFDAAKTELLSDVLAEEMTFSFGMTVGLATNSLTATVAAANVSTNAPAPTP